MLDEGTVKRIKIAFTGLEAPLEEASLDSGFLKGNVALSVAVEAARCAFQEIPDGNKNYIPIANGIPGDMDQLFEAIDKVQWFVDNNPSDAPGQAERFLADAKRLLKQINQKLQ